MRISGTEPSSVILGQTKQFKKVENGPDTDVMMACYSCEFRSTVYYTRISIYTECLLSYQVCIPRLNILIELRWKVFKRQGVMNGTPHWFIINLPLYIGK